MKKIEWYYLPYMVKVKIKCDNPYKALSIVPDTQ